MIETWPFVLVLVSALLHAIWNAIARSGSEPGDVLAASVIASGLICLPGLFLFGLPASASWPYLAAGILVNTAGIRLAMTAYRLTSFGLAYPIMRAGIPLFTLPAAAVLAGEWPGPAGVFGVMVIACALIMLAFAAHRAGRAEARGVAFAVAAAVAGAGYVMLDALGVRLSGNVPGYAMAVSVGNALTIAAFTLIEGRDPAALFRRHTAIGFGIALLSITSFVLFIWVVSVAPIALASALRETSVLFAVAIAAFWLKERIGPFHWTAAALAFAGVLAIRLG